ncbi:uncharacterized protein LOC131887170 isoform X1 [Tigriopus californicus]|uniref:uncharacterized protein LOC131887170 isoform X1 n=1 Tax=Tigriopus californicus TaxID=6832 RepID=UPI0027DA2B58|nr:uncharacterized protein LOC131887170 isoform X1 [Tigriopus californicus]
MPKCPSKRSVSEWRNIIVEEVAKATRTQNMLLEIRERERVVLVASLDREKANLDREKSSLDRERATLIAFLDRERATLDREKANLDREKASLDRERATVVASLDRERATIVAALDHERVALDQEKENHAVTRKEARSAQQALRDVLDREASAKVPTPELQNIFNDVAKRDDDHFQILPRDKVQLQRLMILLKRLHKRRYEKESINLPD